MNNADSNALVDRLWSDLREIRTGMLGLVDAREAHSQPMTAHFEGTDGPLYFYARSDGDITNAIGRDQQGVFHYAGPGHDLYACIHGRLTVSRDQAIIDRFWSDEVARWFPNGRTDGSVALIRFDPDESQIWVPSDSSQTSSIHMGGTGANPVDLRAKADL